MGLLSSFIRSLDDLITQGYPPEVAERIVSGDLPMDFESRMRRAESMGFDPSNVAYHGTRADITEFRPSSRGKMGPGVYTSPSPIVAGSYSTPGHRIPRSGIYEDRGILDEELLINEGANVMPLLLRGDRMERFEALKQNPDIPIAKLSEPTTEGASELATRLEREGITGLEIQGLGSDGMRPYNVREQNTFDPRNVRSLFAAFDPEYKGSNILGGTAGTAGALGLLAAPEEAEAGLSKTAVQLLREEANKLRFGESADAPDVSYRGSHQAPDADYGAPLYDLTEIIPDDIYGPRGERLYGIGDRAVDAEAFEQLRNARGNPDYETPIYRAVPTGVEDINIGDWVTTSREYARMHGENALGGDYNIIESTAPAKKLQSEGYPYEFGLLPVRPETVIGGGTALGLLAAPEDAGAMESPSIRSALEEAGVIGDTLVPTKRPLGERAMGVVDRILTGLEAPQRGLQGLAATGYGLLSGEDFDTAAFRGADVVTQGVDESARQFGDYVFDLTGSPAAATAAYTSGIFGSPL